MGSVTEKVLRMVKAPVLVVRENTSMSSVKSILMPLDLSLNSLSAISFVRNMMGDGEARLHLLHVITTDEYNDDKNARIQAGLQEETSEHCTRAPVGIQLPHIVQLCCDLQPGLRGNRELREGRQLRPHRHDALANLP